MSDYERCSLKIQGGILSGLALLVAYREFDTENTKKVYSEQSRAWLDSISDLVNEIAKQTATRGE